MSNPSGPEPDVDGGTARDLARTSSRPRTQALVTRPREESESLAAALALRDINSIIEPMMEVRYCVAAALDLNAVQAILCTSANGVRALARVTGERGLPLLAVGETTASRALAEGFSLGGGPGGAATDLVCLAAARLRPQNGPLLHAAGNIVAGDLVGALRARGFVIERRVLYEARPVERLSTAAVSALRGRTIDFAAFFSPRTANIFVKLAGSARCRGVLPDDYLPGDQRGGRCGSHRAVMAGSASRRKTQSAGVIGYTRCCSRRTAARLTMTEAHDQEPLAEGSTLPPVTDQTLGEGAQSARPAGGSRQTLWWLGALLLLVIAGVGLSPFGARCSATSSVGQSACNALRKLRRARRPSDGHREPPRPAVPRYCRDQLDDKRARAPGRSAGDGARCGSATRRRGRRHQGGAATARRAGERVRGTLGCAC